MKILVLSNFYPPQFIGGYELGCHQVVTALKSQGHEVLVLSTSGHLISSKTEEQHVKRFLLLANLYSNDFISDSHRQIIHHQAKVSCFHNLFQILESLRVFQPDVIYIHNLLGLGGLAIIDMLDMLKIPWVWHLMDSIPAQLISGIPEHIRVLFSCGRGNFSKGSFISMSQVLLDEILDSGINLGTRVQIIPGWTTPSETLTNRKYGTEGITKFVFAGSIKEHKGIDYIMEAARILYSQNVKSFKIDFYGGGDIQKYILLANRSGISNIVNFFGSYPREQLIEKYRFYDVLLFPTWEREPFGFVAIEAAAEGCLVIMTRQAGCAEILVNNVHCLKINRSSKDLAEAMNKIIINHFLLEDIAQRGCYVSRSDFTLDKLIYKIENCLKTAVYPVDWSGINWDKIYNFVFVKDKLSFSLLSAKSR